MLTKLALAGALAIPLGLFSLSGSAMADDPWTPHDSYTPPDLSSMHKPVPLKSQTEQVRHAAMSCPAASKILREDGYHNVTARDCSIGRYVFHAARNGRAVVLYVNPRNGHVSRG